VGTTNKLVSRCESCLVEAGVANPEGLAADLAEMLDSSTDCEECDGHCCTGFSAVVPHDGKPWSRLRAVRRVTGNDAPWQPCGDAQIIGDDVYVPCTCPHWDSGRCGIYDKRPTACCLYPLSTVLGGREYPNCGLSSTLARWLDERGIDRRRRIVLKSKESEE